MCEKENSLYVMHFCETKTKCNETKQSYFYLPPPLMFWKMYCLIVVYLEELVSTLSALTPHEIILPRALLSDPLILTV